MKSRHAGQVKTLIVDAAVRGWLPRRIAKTLIVLLGLRHV